MARATTSSSTAGGRVSMPARMARAIAEVVDLHIRLAKAAEVKAGDPRFAEFDAKYRELSQSARQIGHRQKPPGLAVTSP